MGSSSNILNTVNPFSNNFLGLGGKQQTQSASGVQQQAFAQFPDLQKAIAQFGFGNVQEAAPSVAGRINAPQPFTLNAMGLMPQQEEGFRRAVMTAMSGNSADYANRGFLRPENINAIAGSAAQNVMPQFAPLIGQQVVAPEQITQNRINQLLQLFDCRLTQQNRVMRPTMCMCKVRTF